MVILMRFKVLLTIFHFDLENINALFLNFVNSKFFQQFGRPIVVK